MPVTPSDIIAVETQAQSDELWALGFLLAADWGQDVTVSTAFQTDVTTHHNDSEQRFGLINRGTRSVEVQQVAFTQDDLLELQVILQRSSIARSLFPLISDFTELTAAVVATNTVLPCDTTNKRFFMGGRVAIVASDYSVFTVGKVAALASGSVTLEVGLDRGYGVGAQVVPLIEAKINLQASISVVTDGVVICKITAQELPGPQALSTMQAPGTVPSAFATYLGYPIFNLQVNLRDEAKIDMVRAGAFSGSGVSQIAMLYGDRMRVNRSGTLTFENRTKAFDFIKLFESRAGCLFPFWVASPTSDYAFVSYGSGQIVVRASGAERDWDYRPWIAVVANDGTVEIRTITGHSRAGGNDTLTLDSSFTISSGSIARVCVAQLSRFKNDALKEVWKSDGVMECLFESVELPGEATVAIENISDPDTDPICSRFDILACQTRIAYSCDNCVMKDCHGNVLLDPDYGPPRCDVTYIRYGGAYVTRNFFNGVDLANGVPGAMNLGEYCGCRRTYVSTGNHCTLSTSGSGTYVNYFTWWCFESGEVQWDVVSYLDFCCCDDLPENVGCPRAG